MYSFAVTDAALFLDSHPNNSAGLEYYRKYKKLYKEAMEEFEEKYGPLSILSDQNDECWAWVKDPWPWEAQN